MRRVVRCLKGKNQLGYVMRRSRNLKVAQCCDPDYTMDSDTDTCGSFRGMIVEWNFRIQKIATLSSTEREYIALSECGPELKFICMFL